MRLYERIVKIRSVTEKTLGLLPKTVGIILDS